MKFRKSHLVLPLGAAVVLGLFFWWAGSPQMPQTAPEKPAGRTFPGQSMELTETSRSEMAADREHPSPKTFPRLSKAQAEDFLRIGGRTPENLCAAFRTSGDKSFLLEAMERFPDQPQVAFEAVFQPGLDPARKLRWIAILRAADPANSMPDYLAAAAHFRDSDDDSAAAALEAAHGKKTFDDLTMERVQSNGEAYRAAGFPEVDGKYAALFQLPLPLLTEMKSLAADIAGLSSAYRTDGDPDSADATVAIALRLGDHFHNSGESLLVHQFLGRDIKRAALATMEPETLVPAYGQTVQELLDGINDYHEGLSPLIREAVPLQNRMSVDEHLSYIDRMKLLGEPNAMDWLRSRFSPSSSPNNK